MKIQFVLSQSNACLVIEKKKKGPSQSYFLALHFGLYSLLFVCFNKHTRTRVKKTSNCVANSCFGKFSLQIAFKF